MNLYERIKDKCLIEGITIKNLEEKAGFPNATIGKWEKQKPSYEKVQIIANCLNVSIDWLITGKEAGTLTPEEEKLVNLYRKADSRGKRNIMNAAEQEAREQESYTSKIG